MRIRFTLSLLLFFGVAIGYDNAAVSQSNTNELPQKPVTSAISAAAAGQRVVYIVINKCENPDSGNEPSNETSNAADMEIANAQKSVLLREIIDRLENNPSSIELSTAGILSQLPSYLGSSAEQQIDMLQNHIIHQKTIDEFNNVEVIRIGK